MEFQLDHQELEMIFQYCEMRGSFRPKMEFKTKPLDGVRVNAARIDEYVK